MIWRERPQPSWDAPLHHPPAALIGPHGARRCFIPIRGGFAAASDAAVRPVERGRGRTIRHGRLDNGLELVVIPDHRAPVVTHMVWYRNGSADDPAGKSGIAHFLEHLMFKGTATHPQGEFSDVVAELGGQENAFTSNDYTAYFQRVSKEHLAP